MPFRFNAKRAFLTYPQCDTLSKERVVEFLRDSCGAAWYCVGLEQHEDGGNHIHAYAEWLRRIDVRDERHFDVDGQHPNVQPVRSKDHVLGYCQKGGDFIGNCEKTAPNTVRYGEIIRNARGKDDFLSQVVQHHPRDAVLHLEPLRQFADWYYAEERDRYVPQHTEFSVPGEMTDWVNVNLSEVGTHIYP